MSFTQDALVMEVEYWKGLLSLAFALNSLRVGSCLRVASRPWLGCAFQNPLRTAGLTNIAIVAWEFLLHTVAHAVWGSEL